MTAGDGIVRASWIGTVVFVLTAAAAVASDLDVIALVVALVLFAVGLVAFLAAFFRAVGRSRTEDIAVSSLFFLAGSAPRPVQVSLLGSLTVQVVAAIVTAAARPYTSLAFGTLVPVYGLSLAGLWAAHHGQFPPRRVPGRGKGTLGRSDG